MGMGEPALRHSLLGVADDGGKHSAPPTSGDGSAGVAPASAPRPGRLRRSVDQRSPLRALKRGVRRGVGSALLPVGYVYGPRVMSALRKRWVLLRNPHANIVFQGRVYLGPGFSLHMPGGGTFIVGAGVEFRRNFRAELGPNGRIVIGAGSYLTYDVIITCDTSIEIGERCGLAQSTFVADGNHLYRDLDVPFLEQGYKYRPIKIEDDVQIHSKSTIVNNIGKRSVIGANAVVTKPIPPYCLAAGVPAQVIDYFGPPGSEPSELSSRSERSG
jgi:acetyltransferase-like isoleucine patch superfamily enzyme